jgi:hypothetical protein
LPSLAAKPMIGVEVSAPLMGFAALYPSYQFTRDASNTAYAAALQSW